MDERDLLARIVATPDDDAPRLVFADHLAEADDPRGELTHVQCALEKGSRDRALRARAKELLPLARARWAAALGLPKGVELELRRGLVEHVVVPLAGWQKVVAKLALVPLRGVTFVGGETADVGRLLSDPAVLRFRELGFVDLPFGKQGLAAFVASDLGAVKSLRFARNGVGAAGARALFAGKNVPALERLVVEDNGLHSEGFEALLDGPWLRKVTRLELHRVNVNTGWEPLGSAKSVAAVRALHLSSSGIYQPGNFIAEVLAEATTLKKLTELTVAGHSLETKGLKSLTALAHSKPELVDLSRNIVGPQAVEAFVTAKVASAVRVLDLSVNKLGDKGGKALLARGALPKIEELKVGGNGISAPVLAELSARFGDALDATEPRRERARR